MCHEWSVRSVYPTLTPTNPAAKFGRGYWWGWGRAGITVSVCPSVGMYVCPGFVQKTSEAPSLFVTKLGSAVHHREAVLQNILGCYLHWGIHPVKILDCCVQGQGHSEHSKLKLIFVQTVIICIIISQSAVIKNRVAIFTVMVKLEFIFMVKVTVKAYIIKM